MTILPWLHFVSTLVLSLGLALYLTPVVRRAALRFGVLDAPDGQLKRQREAVPYLGGIAVYLAFLLTLALVFEFDQNLLGLLLGGTLMAMLGLFDDMKVMSVELKLAGQFLAAIVLLRSDIGIKLEFLPPYVAAPLSVLWLVGVTNAVNILDVSDGLATSTSVVAALGLGVIGLYNGHLLIATTTLALAGSLLGFLRYNRAPARIYLGDAGSLFVGFMLAALSMIGAYTERNLIAAVAPLALLVVPLFELALVSVARLGRGVAPWRGSGDHLALRLKARGWSSRRVAQGATLLSVLGVAAALAMMWASPDVALGVAATLGVGLLGLLVLVLARYPAPY